MILFEQWNAAHTPDEGVVVRLNTGYVTFAGKPIFYEIPCSRFARTTDNAIMTLCYYPPHTLDGEDTCMHVFIRSQEPLTERSFQELGLNNCARMTPEEWAERYEASEKHLTTITLDYTEPNNSPVTPEEVPEDAPDEVPEDAAEEVP